MAEPIVETETDRLRLRRLEASDASFILRLVNEPSWLRFIGDRGVHDLDGARRYIAEGPQRLYANHGFGLFLVERRSDALPLGLCGLIKRDTLPDVDIGFAFLPEHWSQGYAREAAEATLRYARERHHLPRVIAITSLDNVASGRLLERIGLQFEGTVRLAGSNEEVRLYGTTGAYQFDAPNTRPVFDGLWTSGQLSPCRHSSACRSSASRRSSILPCRLRRTRCPAKPRPSRGRAWPSCRSPCPGRSPSLGTCSSSSA